MAEIVSSEIDIILADRLIQLSGICNPSSNEFAQRMEELFFLRDIIVAKLKQNKAEAEVPF